MRRIAQILVVLTLQLSFLDGMAKKEGSGATMSDPQPLWRSAEGTAMLPSLAVSSLPIGGLARSIFVGWIVLYGAFQKKLLPKVKKDGACAAHRLPQKLNAPSPR